MQLNHYNITFNKETFPITLVCENVSNAPNIGSLFRSADAFGIEGIIFCGDNITIGRKITKTSRATEKVVSYKICTNTLNEVKTLKDKGYFIIALEITSNSEPINTFKTPLQQPIALIVGDENFGISEDVLNLSDVVIHINMFGQNSSMNVVQEKTIAFYEITKQLTKNTKV